MTVRLAVFDCDGTLVDGQSSICEAMEQAFGQFALAAPDRATIRRAVGLSLPQAVRGLLPDADADLQRRVVDAYKQAFREARLAGHLSQPLFDGVIPLLDALRADGWVLGVATGMSDRGLTHCLATHGITDRFVTLQTADRHPSKPHPAMLEAALFEAAAEAAHTVMIGDTVFDMAMARDAGVRGVGVDWGYHEPDELRDAGADFVAGTIDELQGYLLR